MYSINNSPDLARAFPASKRGMAAGLSEWSLVDDVDVDVDVDTCMYVWVFLTL